MTAKGDTFSTPNRYPPGLAAGYQHLTPVTHAVGATFYRPGLGDATPVGIPTTGQIWPRGQYERP